MGSSSSSQLPSRPLPPGHFDVKIVFVGDAKVGKTTLITSGAGVGSRDESKTPDSTIPGMPTHCSWDAYGLQLTIDGDTDVDCTLWDTAGGDDYARLRSLSYPMTDIFFVCFSLVDPQSFEKIGDFFTEIWGYSPYKAIVLVGTKLDLREDQETIEALKANGQKPVTSAEGEEARAKFGADLYFECCSLEKEALPQRVEESVIYYIAKRHNPHVCHGMK